MTTERYYLRAGYQTEWTEVTKAQFIEAEQAAGFHSKFGAGHVATGGFSGRGVQGRVDYVDTSQQPTQPPPDDGEWSLSESGLTIYLETKTAYVPIVEAAYEDWQEGQKGWPTKADMQTIMRQIVAEHNAVPKLVTALEDMVDLWARGQKIINGQPRNIEHDSQVIAAREAIALAPPPPRSRTWGRDDDD